MLQPTARTLQHIAGRFQHRLTRKTNMTFQHEYFSSQSDPQGRFRDLRETQAIPGPLGYHVGPEMRLEQPLRRRDSLLGVSFLSYFAPLRSPNYPTMPGERSEVVVRALPHHSTSTQTRVVCCHNYSVNSQYFLDYFSEPNNCVKTMRAGNTHRIYSQIWRLWPSHTFEDRDTCRALALHWEANAASKGFEYPVFREYRQDIREKLVSLRRMSSRCFLDDPERAAEALYVDGFPAEENVDEDHAPDDEAEDKMDIDYDSDESLFGPGPNAEACDEDL